MKIGFILSATTRFPSGGAKIVYEYANFLVSHGHEVSIYFDCSSSLKRFHLPEIMRKVAARYLVWQRPSWFTWTPVSERFAFSELLINLSSLAMQSSQRLLILLFLSLVYQPIKVANSTSFRVLKTGNFPIKRFRILTSSE